MISWRELGRGIYRRFLPAVVVTDLVLSLPTWIATHAAPSLSATIIGLGALVIGYSSVLGLLRKRLRPDAGVDGRRSVVAGVASLGLIVAGAATLRLGGPSLVTGLARLGALYVGSSAIVTLGIYFPWIGARSSGLVSSETLAELRPPLESEIGAGATARTIRDRERVS
jgi:hypothetical protein